jgi:hypothetical protein
LYGFNPAWDYSHEKDGKLYFFFLSAQFLIHRPVWWIDQAWTLVNLDGIRNHEGNLFSLLLEYSLNDTLNADVLPHSMAMNHFRYDRGRLIGCSFQFLTGL